jgi:hypothetical protein
MGHCHLDDRREERSPADWRQTGLDEGDLSVGFASFEMTGTRAVQAVSFRRVGGWSRVRRVRRVQNPGRRVPSAHLPRAWRPSRLRRFSFALCPLPSYFFSTFFSRSCSLFSRSRIRSVDSPQSRSFATLAFHSGLLK